jgi:aspartyl-tRNA(Asn)/glutamyl-tRNA(Gln) amidotransferase subunit A
MTISSEFQALSSGELEAGFRNRAFSPVEVMESIATHISEVEPTLKAFITLSLEEARAQAKAAENAYRNESARPLEGIPVGVKDIFDTEGMRTTYGSRIFASHVPRRDAVAVQLVRAAGGIIVGKTATHEFAWGATSYNAYFESGRNPWALDRVSGGSSGGSAVALASHEVALALGSDTGGSVRIPAAFCGVVGFKPTAGLVSTTGVFPLAPSLDHAGVLARTPRDAASLLSVVAQRPVVLDPNVSGLAVGLSSNLGVPDRTPAVQQAFENAASALVGLGTSIHEVPLPEAESASSTFAVIQRLEALREHRTRGLWPARRDDYGPDVRCRFEASESLTIDDYLAAADARERLRGQVLRAFSDVDLLMSPVAAVPPVPLGEEDVEHFGKARSFRDLVIPFTAPHNLTGFPACVIRAGFDELDIPIGVQLVGRPGADATVLSLAQAFFDATPEVQARWPCVA